MDIRNALNDYFEKTPVPAELDPHNVSSFVVPNITQKKEAEQIHDFPSAPITKAKTMPKPSQPDSVPHSVQQPPKQTQVPMPSQAAPKSLPASAPVSESTDGKTVLGASAFIKVVKYHRLTGSEFLRILGNSKISNSAYQEIENNPGLTVKRLIELLEESPLTPADYEKLIIAVQRLAELKAEAKAKLKAEPVRKEQSASAARTSGAPSSPRPSPVLPAADKSADKPIESEKAKPVSPSRFYPNINDIIPVISNQEDSQRVAKAAGEYDDEEDISEGYGKKEKRAKKQRKSRKERKAEFEETDEFDETEDEEGRSGNIGTSRRKQEPIEEDIEDEDDDEDEDDGRTGSNRGKFIAAAVGAVLLFGISFGLRYYLTGSFLPGSEPIRTEEKTLTEAEIFSAISGLPSPQPAFTQNTVYTAGGVKEDDVLTDMLCKNKRLMYIQDNKLFIYEQIGGQVAELAVKDYGERQLLGLIEAGDRTAAVSVGTSAPYSFTYTVPSESGDDEVMSGTVERRETYIELLDASAPENESSSVTVTLSGTFSAAYFSEGRILTATYEALPNGSAVGDNATFMPYVVLNESKQLCAADKVYLPKTPSGSGFLSIFSLDLNGSIDIAAAAGGSAQLVSRAGNELFVGQGSTVIRYDLTDGVKQNGEFGISGEIGDFSGISAQEGEIRVTSLENSAVTLSVFDSELVLKNEVKNIGVDEIPFSTCFNGMETYIVTQNGACYGIDGENAVMSQSSVKITNENIYKYSDSIGLKVTPNDDGTKRTGLTVSTVRLDGTLGTLYSLEISSRTVAVSALDEYISSPAETDISCIGGTAENGVAVIPVVYFDGVSQVEMFVICTVTEEGILSVNGTINEYDRQSEHIFAAVDGDTVIAVTKGKITTAKAADGAVQGYFNI